MEAYLESQRRIFKQMESHRGERGLFVEFLEAQDELFMEHFGTPCALIEELLDSQRQLFLKHFCDGNLDRDCSCVITPKKPSANNKDEAK